MTTATTRDLDLQRSEIRMYRQEIADLLDARRRTPNSQEADALTNQIGRLRTELRRLEGD